MSAEQYATLPDELTLREVRIRVAQKGFRTQSLVVVTTLLDAEQYPPEEIALLYRRRWQAELHLRSLKIVLQMDHLRCKTPERVRNEFCTHLLGYNLIRGVMAAAALQSGKIAVGDQFQGNAANAQPVSPAAVVERSQRSVVHGVADGRGHTRRRQSARSFRAAPRQTPPQTLQTPAETPPRSTQLEMSKAVSEIQVPFSSDPFLVVFFLVLFGTG